MVSSEHDHGGGKSAYYLCLLTCFLQIRARIALLAESFPTAEHCNTKLSHLLLGTKVDTQEQLIDSFMPSVGSVLVRSCKGGHSGQMKVSKRLTRLPPRLQWLQSQCIIGTIVAFRTAAIVD